MSVPPYDATHTLLPTTRLLCIADEIVHEDESVQWLIVLPMLHDFTECISHPNGIKVVYMPTSLTFNCVDASYWPWILNFSKILTRSPYRRDTL